MACSSLSGVTKSCLNNVGGITAVLINDTDYVSYTADTATHSITGITATPAFKSFEFKRNVGNVVVEPQIDLINGSTFYQATVTLVFHRREAATSRALSILAEGQRYLEIIFLDANGTYWYIDHAQLNGGPEETGTVKADGSKYTVTFVADMLNRPYTISSTLVDSVD